MAQGKLTPRQKMINMMYLVLTALLALNITKEVINAFVTINDSIEISKGNIEKKNADTYAAFKQAMSVDASKYQAVNAKAQNIRKAADSLVMNIQTLKENLIRESDKVDKGKNTPELKEMERKDDYDVPTTVMCGTEQDGKGKEATRLKAMMEQFKKTIVANQPDNPSTDYQKSLNILLNTSDPDPKSEAYKSEGKRTWEMNNFYHNPVVATVALLTKYQSDVRNAESHITDDLLSSVDKNIIKLNQFTAKVIANSTVVTIGSDYQADVFLSATSSTMAPEVFIGATTDSAGSKNCKGCDAKPLPVADGYGKYTDRPGSEGEKKWSGVIRVKKPDGSYEHYPFSESYQAQKPNSVVSADKMNVLYIGVDNPMSISVPGVSNDKVKVSIEGGGGSLKANTQAGGGHYIASVTTVGKSTIKVSAEIAGKPMPMGSFEYRVKRVPDPVATISNSKGGPINKNLLAAGTLIPVLENFDFELFFKIMSFKITIVQTGKDPLELEGQGNQLTQPMRDAVSKLRGGSKVYIEYIKAKMATGADQSTRSLSPMSFVIQ
ncbi:MAG: gliding motility protein GldM [Bacteroidetes bacterium]|nr:gliding motility protein GldM [Bacteroidota bacterium]